MDLKTADISLKGDIVASLSKGELNDEIKAPDKLKIWEGKAGWRNLEVAWVPFDTTEQSARIAVFGVTPGREQMGNALRAYREARLSRADHDTAARIGKATGVFSGDMRETLIRILDEVSIPGYLGANSSHALCLWGSSPRMRGTA